MKPSTLAGLALVALGLWSLAGPETRAELGTLATALAGRLQPGRPPRAFHERPPRQRPKKRRARHA